MALALVFEEIAVRVDTVDGLDVLEADSVALRKHAVERHLEPRVLLLDDCGYLGGCMGGRVEVVRRLDVKGLPRAVPRSRENTAYGT